MTLGTRLAPLLALTLLAPLAGAHGPYYGLALQGSSDRYTVDHDGPACLDSIRDWSVTLEYSPASDTLTLTVPGRGSDVGQNGFAEVTFRTMDSCALFDVYVNGTSVATAATYTMDVNF